MRRFSYLYIITAVVALSLGGIAVAQLVEEPVSLTSSPESPSPGEEAVITASTPTANKNFLFFDWKVGGKARPDISGQGKNSFTLTAGDVGSTIRVDVDISGPALNISKSFTLRVSELSLAWFADTSVPKWYKGKALPSANSVVRVVAVPRLVTGNGAVRPGNIIYTWSLDDQENILSGVGEQTFIVHLSPVPGASNHVSLVAETPGGEIRKTANLYIRPVNPQVEIYPLTPLGGIEYRSSSPLFPLGVRGLVDFVAEPFYFPAELVRNISYSWNSGGFALKGNEGKPNVVSINTGDHPLSAVTLGVTAGVLNSYISQVSKFITLVTK